jgi:hypothetical protein
MHNEPLVLHRHILRFAVPALQDIDAIVQLTPDVSILWKILLKHHLKGRKQVLSAIMLKN